MAEPVTADPAGPPGPGITETDGRLGPDGAGCGERLGPDGAGRGERPGLDGAGRGERPGPGGAGGGERPGRDGAGTAGPPRLDGPRIAERLERLDELLAHLERMPGPTTEAALDAVTLLTEVYGEALARVADRLESHPDLAAGLADDDLVGHLLVLHGLHPAPVEERVARALEGVRPYLRSHGGDVQLAGIEDGVARVRLSAKGCGSSPALVRDTVDAAIAAAAPELSGVEPVETPAGPAAFIPAESLLRRPEGAV